MIPSPRPALFAGARTRSALLLVFGLLVATTGCVVHTGSDRGVLEVQWAPVGGHSCASLGVVAVRVRIQSDGVLLTELANIACEKGFQTLNVDEGVYTVVVEGLSSSGALVAETQAQTVTVLGGYTQPTGVLPLVPIGPPASSFGSVAVAWTLQGEAPGTACGKYGLQTIVVSVLDDSQAKILASAEAACTAGQITVPGVAAGARYLQLDGKTPQGVFSFGNTPLYGPVQVFGGATTAVPNAVNVIDLRAVVSLDWAFVDGGTCGSHNVGNIRVEVRDSKDQVVIPMTDPYATKPCNLTPDQPYGARVLDMQFAQPTCTIPPGAKGLVICNIVGSTIGLAVSSVDASTGQVQFGGSMQIKQIPAGQHTAIATPLLLAPCSASNPCTAP